MNHIYEYWQILPEGHTLAASLEIDNAAQIDAERFGVSAGELFGELFEHRLPRGVGLCNGVARAYLQSDEVVAIGVERIFLRDVDISFAPSKAGRQDADDAVGLAHKRDGAADDVWIARVIALPELVPEYDHSLRFVPWRLVRRDEPSPLRRGSAQ